MTRSRRNHCATVVLYPKAARFEADAPVTGQYSYSGKALASKLPHGPDHDCLMCSDLRHAIGHVVLDPDPYLTDIGRRILERAAALDDTRVSLAHPMPIGPTLTVSAGVGALLGVVSALWVML